MMRLGNAVLSVALLSACGGAANPSAGAADATEIGALVKNLAAGQLEALPTGPVYIQVTMFTQPAGGVIPSKKHVPGIILEQKGLQRLLVEGSPPLDIHSGEADFLPSVTHEHLNPGPGGNVWYNFALWPESARSAPLTSPIATVAFSTPDLPASALPAGAYSISLQMTSLTPHGRTQARSFGGVSVLFVLTGSISAHTAGGTAVTLGPGGGAWSPGGTGLQEFEDTGQPATFVTFVVAAVGQPFETALSHGV